MSVRSTIAAASIPALHPPIIDRDTWDQVQALLASNTAGTRKGNRAASPSLLAGKVRTAPNEPLLAVHATKGATRYRYYVSRGLHSGTSSTGLRIPARELELAVTARLTQLFADPLALIGTCWLTVPSGAVGELMTRCADIRLSPAATHRHHRARADRAGHGRQRPHRDHLLDRGTSPGCSRRNDRATPLPPSSSARQVTLTRSGSALRLVQADGSTVAATPNQALVRLILRARRWWGVLSRG